MAHLQSDLNICFFCVFASLFFSKCWTLAPSLEKEVLSSHRGFSQGPWLHLYEGLTGWGRSLLRVRGDEESSINVLFVSFKPKAMWMIHYFTWRRQSMFIMSHYHVTLRHAVTSFASHAFPAFSTVTSITTCLLFLQRNENHIRTVQIITVYMSQHLISV